MNRNYPLALIASGPTRHNIFSRIPALRSQLGPVKALSLRTAAKVSNALRAGWAARDWTEIQEREMILVSCSSPDLEPILREMRQAGQPWHGCTIVFCDVDLPPSAGALADSLGASIVEVSLTFDSREPAAVITGEESAARRVQRRLAAAGAETILVRQGAKTGLTGALASVEAGTLAILHSAAAACTAAGLRKEEARRLAVQGVLDAVRAYTRRARLGPQHDEALASAALMLTRSSETKPSA